MPDQNREVLDLVSQVEAQLLATQAAIRCILAADPELRNTVARELEQVRASRPGRVVSDSVFAAMDRAIRRMVPNEVADEEVVRDLI